MKYSIELRNRNLEIFLDEPEGISFAAYLYKNRVCIEKKMYTFGKSIRFDYEIKNNKGLFFIKIFIKEKSIKIVDTDFFYINNYSVNKIELKNIFESENILIEGYFQGSDILFFTFNGTKSTKKSKPFGVDFLVQNGWDCIAVYQDNDTQYQYLSRKLTVKRTVHN